MMPAMFELGQRSQSMRGKWPRSLFALTLAAALIGGCVTADQVKDIVEDANRESLVASLGGSDANLEPGTQGAPVAAWENEVARIEDFIVSHPDQPRTNNALRIREAILLLNAQQPNLARAVFAEVEREQLVTERDRALYDVHDHLIWWYGLGTTLSAEDRERAQSALTGIAEVADGLERSSQTRRFLEETRVRIALRLAHDLSDPGDIRSVLDEAMDRYEAQFDASDRQAIQAWHAGDGRPGDVVLKSLRWYDYVPQAFAWADEIVAGACEAACPSYTPLWIACLKDNSCE
jgi:hypothetical protein